MMRFEIVIYFDLNFVLIFIIMSMKKNNLNDLLMK